MQKLRAILLQSTEYLLLVSTCFYWYSSGVLLNPVAILLVLLLIYQILSKNYITGIIVPTLFILGSLFMILTLFSELREFNTFNSTAQRLLIVGLTYFILTIAASGFMLYKYASHYPKKARY